MSWEWFRGEFARWEDAAALAGSYGAPAILERVVAASREVRDGAAAYERDGWAFTEPRLNAPLVAALARTAPSARRLRVLDFGGALGSLYWQHRGVVRDGSLDWRVVEQPHYVSLGRSEFQGETLTFWPDVVAACQAWRPDLVVLSSVLQYLPEPWALLDTILALDAEWLFFDRLPLLETGTDRLTIEHVPPDLGGGSYPAWFLGETRFLATLQPRYATLDRFRSLLEGDTPETWNFLGARVDNQGFLFRRKPTPA